MQGIFVAYGRTDIANGQAGKLQQLGGLGHAVADEKLLRRTASAGVKDASQIASINATLGSNVLDGNTVLEILFNKINGFFNIIITHFTAGSRSVRRR